MRALAVIGAVILIMLNLGVILTWRKRTWQSNLTILPVVGLAIAWLLNFALS